MSPIFLDAIALAHRPDLDVLFLRWPQPVYGLSAREVYLQVLELARETNARYWLFDVRSRGPLSTDDLNWVKEKFYPELHGHLNQITHVAYLATPAHAEDLTTLSSIKEMRQQPWYGQKADFEVFTFEPDALLWLKKCQFIEIDK